MSREFPPPKQPWTEARLSAVLWITNFPAFPDSKKFQLIGLETHVSTAFNRWYRRYSTDSGSMVPTIFDEFQIESDTESTPYYQYHFEKFLKGAHIIFLFWHPETKERREVHVLGLEAIAS